MRRSVRGNRRSCWDNEEAAARGSLRPTCHGKQDGSILVLVVPHFIALVGREKKKSPSPFKSRSSRGTDWEAADRAEGTGETSASVLFIVKKTVWGGGGGGGVQNKTGLLMPALWHAQLPGAGMQNNAPHVH